MTFHYPLRPSGSKMFQRDFCFEAVGKAQYALFMATLLFPLPYTTTPSCLPRVRMRFGANLGPEVRNPSYEVRPHRRPYTEKHPALLWVALVAVIALLGGIALRSSSPMCSGKAGPKTSPNGEEQEPRMETSHPVLPSCGLCPACAGGRANACQRNQTMGVQRDGAMTELISVPREKLYMGELSLKELCLVAAVAVG